MNRIEALAAPTYGRRPTDEELEWGSDVPQLPHAEGSQAWGIGVPQPQQPAHGRIDSGWLADAATQRGPGPPEADRADEAKPPVGMDAWPQAREPWLGHARALIRNMPLGSVAIALALGAAIVRLAR